MGSSRWLIVKVADTYDVVDADEPTLEQILARVAVVEGEPELDDVQADVLVEGVQDDFADALVVPGAVNKQ